MRGLPIKRMSSQPERPHNSVDEQEPAGWRFAFRALLSRNYRLFFGGQSISLIGTWMTRLATSWLVYRLTGSAYLLGLVGFAGQVPTFVFGPFAGVWVDRLDRRQVLIVTQVLSMIQSFWLAALVLWGHITFAEILWLSIFQGVVNAFDMPARQAFLTQMVDKREDLPNAIALNSSMVNGSRLVGPSLAGIVIALYGEGYCFLIDGFSYIAVIFSLFMMTVTVRQVAGKRVSAIVDLREGWRYVTRFQPVRSILLLLGLVSLVGMPYTVLMPIFATRILHGGPHTLGFLMGASGIGALASAIWLATRKSVLGLGRVIPIMSAMFGAGLISFSLSHWLSLSLILMLFTGFGMMQQMAASNTILQTIVDENMRGRVMSYYSMAFAGSAPFGSLAAGIIADRIGAPATLMVGGGACILGAAWFVTQLKQIRHQIRPIYIRLGILPEMAAGIETATVLQDTVER
jgi:MFS family permease